VAFNGLGADLKPTGAVEEMTLMPENPFETIERLGRLAAWHRINAERAGADWVWEARLRAAEDLERQAAKIRAQLFDDRAAGRSAKQPGKNRASAERQDQRLAVSIVRREPTRRDMSGNSPPGAEHSDRTSKWLHRRRT
jgi:hypothetical protein